MQKGYIGSLPVELHLNDRTKRLIHSRVNLKKISIVDLCTTQIVEKLVLFYIDYISHLTRVLEIIFVRYRYTMFGKRAIFR